MKLLATITALLLSLLAFSQDLIEYNDGNFSRNGEELSIKEVERLTKELKAGRRAKVLLSQGILRNDMVEIKRRRNTTSILTAGIGGIYSAGSFETGNFVKELLGWRELQIAFYGLGVTLIPSTVYLAFKISQPDYWINRRDKSFKKLARKLNKALIKSKKKTS